MKLLFVIEHFYPYYDASSKVLKNLLSSKNFKNHEIHIISIGHYDLVDDSIIIHNISLKETFFSKIKNKLFKGRFVKNKPLITKIKSKIEIICNENHIDHVLYVVGDMNLLLINPCVSAKQSYIFYDSLLDNFFYNRESQHRITKIQSNAFRRATYIFLLEEYLELYKKYHSDFANKFNRFFITAFYNDKPLESVQSNLLLHAGAFFAGLREPTLFFNFLNRCDRFDLGIKAITLGELPKTLSNIAIPKNLSIMDRVFGTEYDKLVRSCECLVLVDNCLSCNQIPSKAYEYIGYNKKILFFTNGGTNTAKLLENNRNVYLVENNINENTIRSFQIFLKASINDERKKYFKNEKDYVAHYLLEKLL